MSLRTSLLLLAICLAIPSALFAQTQPVNTAIVPVPKLETDIYDWYARHQQILDEKARVNPQIVLIGDSITHFWFGRSAHASLTPPSNVPSVSLAFGQKRVLNLGFGWDRTQNVLWRLDHGEFDGLSPQYVVILIGTNNLTSSAHARENPPEQIVEGIAAIVAEVRSRSPASHIVLTAVFPRGNEANSPFRAKVAALDALEAAYARSQPDMTYLDIGKRFIAPDGSIPKALMADGVHPTERGYLFWAEALKEVLK
jgi:lysophospholipase L1-like esterase